MKLAIVAGFNAFLAQVRENRLEQAKKICEKSGLQVVEKAKTNSKKEN